MFLPHHDFRKTHNIKRYIKIISCSYLVTSKTSTSTSMNQTNRLFRTANPITNGRPDSQSSIYIDAHDSAHVFYFYRVIRIYHPIDICIPKTNIESCAMGVWRTLVSRCHSLERQSKVMKRTLLSIFPVCKSTHTPIVHMHESAYIRLPFCMLYMCI